MDGKALSKPSTRLKSWQKLWLDRHQELLTTSLQGHVTAIADRLVGKGDIDPSQDEAYQLISSQHTVPVEKVRCLLDFLRKKPPEVFGHFQEALCEFGCRELVASDSDVVLLETELDSLPAFERLSLYCPASVQRARTLLKALYMKAAGKVHVLEGLSRNKEGSSKDLDDIFVNIGLVSSDDVEKLCSEWTGKDGGVDEVLANALVTRQISLHDLWRVRRGSSEEPEKIIALGTAGSGKTLAFTVKASYEWCGGKFWEQMALMRTIRCRDKSVWLARRVSELFRLPELGLSTAEEKEVEAFIIEHPRQVALVCDGLDEGSVDKDSFLWRVLCEECLPGLRIIVTSRPCAEVTDLSVDGSIDRHLQLFGFNKESVQAFVFKHLGEVDGEKMKSQLSQNPSILSLMHTPFFALLICEQFKEVGQLPRRRTDIFSRVVLKVVQRFARRQGLKSTFKTVDKAPGQLFDKVLEVGKVALDRLKSKDLSYFELEDTDLSAKAVGLGFLEHVQATSSSDEDQYGFRHLTVQEYLAAVYACNKVLKSHADVARLCQELGCGQEAGYLNTFWVFVAGLLGRSLREELFCAIAKTDMQTVSRSVPEARESGAGAVSFEKRLAKTESEPSETKTGAPAAHQKETQPASTPLNMYRFLLLLHCYAEGVADGPGQSSACVGYVLKQQGFTCRNRLFVSQSELSVISRALECHSQMVEKVDMEGCYLGDDRLQQLLPGLHSCTRLKELNLCANQLTETSMEYLGDVVVRNRRSLEVVDISNNKRAGDEGLRRLGNGLKQVAHLRCLPLGDSGLTNLSGRLIADIVSRQPTLAECNLNRNQIEDSAFADIGSALKKCKHLKKLYLYGTGLTNRSSTLLSSLLASLPHLSALELGYCKLDGEILPGLQQCTALRVLRLDDCGLTDRGQLMPLLTLTLLSLPDLEKFSLSGNQIGDTGLDQISVAMEECCQLTRLWLDDTGLTSLRSMQTICRLLQRLTRLKSLYVYGNPYTGGVLDMRLCAAVKRHPSLHTLCVSTGICRDAIRRLTHLKADPTCSLRCLAVWGSV